MRCLLPTGRLTPCTRTACRYAPFTCRTAANDVTSATQTAPQDQAGRDRTYEASTSAIAAASAALTAIPKKDRPPPVPIKPPVITPELLPNGVLLVDKDLDWTSFDVCAKVRNSISKSYGIKKVGHAGTLDPMATGLLIICTGSGTKAIDGFVAQDKEYTGTIKLGEGTSSYDAETEVSERLPWEHITDADLQAAAASFLGDSQQVPPMFSAIKVNGQKMYELAREGQSIELAARPITLHSFDVTRDAEHASNVHFRVRCSKGTYVRSLARDFGSKLGTAAHLLALRREAIGGYRVDDAWRMPQLIAELTRLRAAYEAAKKAKAAGSQAS